MFKKAKMYIRECCEPNIEILFPSLLIKILIKRWDGFGNQ